MPTPTANPDPAPSPTASPSPDPWPARAMAATLVMGVVLRLAEVAAAPYPWLDEASLGLEVHRRDFSGLTAPLEFGVVAPVGYLWILKATERLLGTPAEWALRLPSLAASLLALAATAWLAWRRLPPWGAVAATVLSAGSPFAVYYAWELKPYAQESAITIGLLCVAVVPAGTGWIRPLPLALLSAATLPWFSFASVFLLPGTLLETGLRDRASRTPRTGALVMLVLGSAALFLAWAGPVRQWYGDFMREFHRPEFAPWDRGVGPIATWISSRFEALLAGLAGLGRLWLLGAGLALVGIRRFAREDRPIFRTTTLALALWLGAGLAHLYPTLAGRPPLAARMCLFLLPVVALAVGSGVSALEAGRLRFLAPVLVAVLGWQILPDGSLQWHRKDRRAPFQRIFAEVGRDDVVALSTAAWTQWHLHVAAGRVPRPPRAVLRVSHWGGKDPVPEVRMPPDATRVWWLDDSRQFPNQIAIPEWEAQLRSGFELAPQQPPEPSLRLWLRRSGS